jgi:hypothetical protein
MTDAEEQGQESEAGAARSGEPEVQPPASSQRLRAILAGLVTVAILAVLAIAVFSGGADDDDPPPANTVVSDGTGGDTSGAAEQPAEGGEELGSLAVTGYLCPSASSDEAACLDAGPVEIVGATVRIPDGRTYSLEGVERQEDGSYAWLNIPIGEYILLTEGLLGPDGSLPRTVIGSTGQTAEGWTIPNLDPNQPAVLQILFDPLAEGEAAG